MGKIDVVSEEGRSGSAAEGQGGSSPTSGLTFEDPFYDSTGTDPDGFEHGSERRGTVRGKALNESNGRTRWEVHLVLAGGGSQIDAEGQLANRPDGRPGPGTLTVTNATGDWANVRRVNVSAKNPRRWKSV